MVDIITNIYANNYYMVCFTKSILDLMVCNYVLLSATFQGYVEAKVGGYALWFNVRSKTMS